MNKFNKFNNSEEIFIGFARIFSGTIKEGQPIKVLSPKYNPLKPELSIQETTVKSLFLLMGRDLEQVDKASAGSVFGIGGLDAFVLRTATLSSQNECIPFNLMTYQASPIIRVAIEPENISDISKLDYGLKMLNQSDPAVEVLIQETGERVIIASGELHLERCLSDLRNRFSKIPLTVSSPIVSFKETITKENSRKFKTIDLKHYQTANKMAQFKISAVPLPKNIKEYLIERREELQNALVDRLLPQDKLNALAHGLEREFKKVFFPWKEIRHRLNLLLFF